MPEIIESEKIVETETKRIQPVTVWSTVSGIALSAALTFGLSEKVEQDTYRAKIEASKYEIVSAVLTPETIIETLRDTVVKGDTVTLTDIDTIPARKEYVRSYASSYIPTEGDTMLVTMTRKRGDSIMYYGVYPVTPEETPRLKISFDKMN